MSSARTPGMPITRIYLMYFYRKHNSKTADWLWHCVRCIFKIYLWRRALSLVVSWYYLSFRGVSWSVLMWGNAVILFSNRMHLRVVRALFYIYFSPAQNIWFLHLVLILHNDVGKGKLSEPVIKPSCSPADAHEMFAHHCDGLHLLIQRAVYLTGSWMFLNRTAYPNTHTGQMTFL